MERVRVTDACVWCGWVDCQGVFADQSRPAGERMLACTDGTPPKEVRGLRALLDSDELQAP